MRRPSRVSSTRERVLQEHDVAARGVVDAARAPDVVGARAARCRARPTRPGASIRASTSSGSLKPSRREELDAVVLVRVVATRRSSTPASQRMSAVRNAMPGVGIGPDLQHVDAHRADARRRARPRTCSPRGACPCRSGCAVAVAAAATGTRGRRARPSCSAISAVIGWTFARPADAVGPEELGRLGRAHPPSPPSAPARRARRRLSSGTLHADGTDGVILEPDVAAVAATDTALAASSGRQAGHVDRFGQRPRRSAALRLRAPATRTRGGSTSTPATREAGRRAHLRGRRARAPILVARRARA